jgi:hypothetical protein
VQWNLLDVKSIISPTDDVVRSILFCLICHRFWLSVGFAARKCSIVFSFHSQSDSLHHRLNCICSKSVSFCSSHSFLQKQQKCFFFSFFFFFFSLVHSSSLLVNRQRNRAIDCRSRTRRLTFTGLDPQCNASRRAFVVSRPVSAVSDLADFSHLSRLNRSFSQL